MVDLPDRNEPMMNVILFTGRKVETLESLEDKDGKT